MTKAEREIQQLAADRVAAIEPSLNLSSETPIALEIESGSYMRIGAGSEEVDGHRIRTGQSVRAVGEELLHRETSGRFPLEDIRQQLPALRKAEELVEEINSHDVTIIAGDTGIV